MAILIILGLGDMLNFPGLELLDTTFPIDTWTWLLIFIIIPNASDSEDDED